MYIERVYINKLTSDYAKWKEKKEFLEIYTAMVKCEEKKAMQEALHSHYLDLKFPGIYEIIR